MQDGKGALYFVGNSVPMLIGRQEPILDVTRPIIRIQATKQTRQQMREDCPSGVVSMDRMLGRKFTPGFVLSMALLSVVALAAINYMLPPGWQP